MNLIIQFIQLFIFLCIKLPQGTFLFLVLFLILHNSCILPDEVIDLFSQKLHFLFQTFLLHFQIIRYNWQEKQTLFAESSAEAGSVLADYLQAFTDAEKIIPNYQTKWNSVLQEETIGKGLPLLAEGEISIEEFLEMMEESILEYQAEQ